MNPTDSSRIMPSLSLPFRALAGLPAALALACGGLAASAHAGEPAAAVAIAPPQSGGLTPQILYQYMLAEIAANRGQFGLAAEAYVELATSTRDARIARRAAEVAFYARQFEGALSAARIWQEQAPESAEARQTLWMLLAATGRGDELLRGIEVHLKSAGTGTGKAVLDLGRLLARWPDKPAAERLLIQATSDYESLPETFYVRAQAAHAARASERALSNIDQALALKPDWEAAVLFKAQLTSADAVRTTELLADYLRRHPGSHRLRLAYARALVDADRYGEARQQFERLIAERQDSPELLYSAGLLALQMRDLAGGERYLRQLAGTDFPDQDSVHYYLGHAAEEAGRGADAISEFDQVGTRSSHFVSSRARAASLLRKQGRIEEGRQRLQQAAIESPKARGDLVLVESRLLAEAKQYEEAYKVLDAALSELPDDTALLYESALAAERSGKFDVLERNLQKLIRLQPDNPQAYNALGYSLADRNQRLEEAQQLIEKALSLAPQDPFILDSRGWVAYRRGDAAAAIEYLRRALSISADPEVAAHLGEVLWTQGQRDEARATWNNALKANPENEVLPATIRRFEP